MKYIKTYQLFECNENQLFEQSENQLFEQLSKADLIVGNMYEYTRCYETTLQFLFLGYDRKTFEDDRILIFGDKSVDDKSVNFDHLLGSYSDMNITIEDFLKKNPKYINMTIYKLNNIDFVDGINIIIDRIKNDEDIKKYIELDQLGIL